MRLEFIMQKRKVDYMRSKSCICWEKKFISSLSFYKLKLSIYKLKLSFYILSLSIENFRRSDDFLFAIFQTITP